MKIMKLTQKESYWSSVELYIHLSYGGNVCSILINVDDLLLNVSMLAKHYGIFIRNSLASCQSMKHCVWEHLGLCDFSLLITSGTKMDHTSDRRRLSKASNCGRFQWCNESANVWKLDWKHTLQWWGWTTVHGNQQHGADNGFRLGHIQTHYIFRQ